ncbi:MAG: lipid-A-disaccharide synthase, partial [Dysgonamonadaceae bacterium]|nr:lipid-A-disaccharide synthase [Dysgonamonadaceae bacterium]
MKYFLIVGEASGDLHASNLMQSLLKADPAADFRYFGGDLMQAVGGTLVRHYRDMAYMGFIPVLMHLRTISRNMELCKQTLGDYRPDVVILVDYAGFNLRIARYIKTHLHPSPSTIYYISPKIWAWKEYRIHTIKKYIDRMLCILPFEVEFYKKYHYDVDYAGNPTVDAIAERKFASETFETFTRANHLTGQPVIALLAGSRKQEIKDNLPAMLDASDAF